MASKVSAERVDVFMSGRTAAFVKVFSSDINPSTETSIEYTCTGMFLKLLCRQVLMFSYLLSLNCLDFCRFVSWQTVSSSTNIFDSSHITMSGRVLDWNATSIDSNSADGRSTSRRWSALLCVHIQFAIMSRILLCRSKYRLRAAEQFDKTCLFVCKAVLWQSGQFGSSILFHLFRFDAVGSCCWNAFRTKRKR